MNRRELLLGTAISAIAVALPYTKEAAAQIAQFSGEPEFIGRINMGLGEPSYFGAPILLNKWKGGGTIEVVKDGVTYLTSNVPGHSLSAWQFLDANGDLLNPLPAGVTSYKRIWYGPPSVGISYDPTIETMYYSFTGTATTVEVTNSTWQSARVGNYREFKVTSSASNTYIYWQNIGTNDPPRNIVVAEVRYKARIDAGELFDPRYMRELERSAGLLRTTTLNNGYRDQTTLSFADIPTTDYCFWTGGAPRTGIKGGMPLGVLLHLQQRLKKHFWFSTPMLIGMYKARSVSNITNGKTSTVLSYGHTFDNGDQLSICSGPNWGLDDRAYTVSNSNQGAHTYDIDLDSSGFGAYDTNYQACAIQPPNLANITTELTPLFETLRDNIHPRFLIFLEYGNENWNPGFFSKAYCTAAAVLRYGSDSLAATVQFAGYIAAHHMRVARDVFGASGRSRWRGVFTPWTVVDNTHDNYLAGIDEYIAEQIPGTPITDLFDHVGITSYWQGPHASVYKATLFSWMDTSEARWIAGLEPTKYAYYDRLVNECRYDGSHLTVTNNVQHYPVYWQLHKTRADKRGLTLVHYEANDADEMFASGLWAACNASEQTRLMEFYKETTHSELSARNYEWSFNEWEKFGTWHAKFIDLAPVTQFGNWGGQRFLGDSNPVWDAVIKYNRKGNQN